MERSSPNVAPAGESPMRATLDESARLARLERLSRALDTRFRVPILGIPIGWDAILGLIPGVGALVTLAPSGAMIYEGLRIGARKRTLARMAGNTLIDMGLGSIPVLGDVADVFFKSHRRNIKLLLRETARPKASS